MSRASLMSLVSLASLLSLLSPSSAAAQAADIKIITAPIVIEAGDSLIIPAGRELVFAPFTGITVKPGGRLIARGTIQQPVAFTSTADTAGSAAAFDWVGVAIERGGSAELRYTLIIYSTTGITADTAAGLILDQCIFSDNGQWNLSLGGVAQDVPNLQPFDFGAPPPTVAIQPEQPPGRRERGNKREKRRKR